MTQPRDPDAIIATWLDDGPIDLPEDTRRAIVVALRTQPRARRMAILGGLPVNPLSRFLAAAAIVLAIGGLSIFALSNRGGSGPGAQPTASPAASTAPSPSAPPTASPSPNLLDTATWTPFDSNRYGFSISYPADWEAEPASHDWTYPADAINYLAGGSDHFELKIPDQGVGVNAWSVAVAPGTSLDAWILAYCTATGGASCSGLADQTFPATMDGHPGSLVIIDSPQAFFLVDDRIYAVACYRTDDDPSVAKYSGARRLVEAYLSTMRLLPGGPAPASSSPAPS